MTQKQKVSELNPDLLWRWFSKISQIPRGSGKEKHIRRFIEESVCGKKGLSYKTDEIGNIFIDVPATPGMEKCETIILQAHMDMVCKVAQGINHNFETDPIELVIENDWVHANGTTLGADNGIGLAAALAIIDDPNVQHGPLQMLFTVDEESGMTGAFAIDPKDLHGTTLINLDTEENRTIYIGCAGYRTVTATVPFLEELVNSECEYAAFNIKAQTSGGHSGVRIGDKLANAIELIARLLYKAKEFSIKVANIMCENQPNAIPDQANATVLVPIENVDSFLRFVAEMNSTFRQEYEKTEPELEVTADEAEQPDTVIDETSLRALIECLLTTPNGALAWSQTVEHVVETSANLASIVKNGNEFEVVVSVRSLLNSKLDYTTDKVMCAWMCDDNEVSLGKRIPSWAPNPAHSEILKICQDSHKEVFGEEPKIKVIHAGFECAIIGDRIPFMDMISIGPLIEHAHEPTERVNIPSVKDFWTVLLAILLKAPQKVIMG